jgi:hypothetical protein
MMQPITNLLKKFLPRRQVIPAVLQNDELRPALHAVGFNDFLSLNMPPREMLLDPILPERSLAMLYAPRGVGKTLLGLSIGLAVTSGVQLLRWTAPRQRRVLYVDGEMPLVSLQERLRLISAGFGVEVLNDGFRILAADHTENGISLGSEDGQNAIEPLLGNVDPRQPVNSLHDWKRERERSMGANAELPAQTSASGHCRLAHSSCGRKRSATRHIAARRCPRHCHRLEATRRLLSRTRCPLRSAFRENSESRGR